MEPLGGIMAVRYKIRVGDKVHCFGEPETYEVEKIEGKFFRLSEVGVRHINSIEHIKSPHFIGEKLIETIENIKSFFDDIPIALLSSSVLNIKCYDESLLEIFEGFEGKGGLGELKSWIDDVIVGSNPLGNTLVFTDKDGLKNHLVIDLQTGVRKAILKLSGEYTSEPIHYMPNLQKVESLIEEWCSKSDDTFQMLKLGAALKKEILIDPDIDSELNKNELNNLFLTNELLVKCLNIWPDQPYGYNPPVSYQEWLLNIDVYEGIMESISIILNLIISGGKNQ